MSKQSEKWAKRAGILLSVVGLTLTFIGVALFGPSPGSASAVLLLGVVVLLVGIAFLLDSGWLPAFIERRTHALWRMTTGRAAPGSDEEEATTQRMGSSTLTFAVVYLLGFFVFAIGGMWAVWDARPIVPTIELPDSVANGPAPDPAQPPTIDSIAPATVTFGVGQATLFVFGSGFSENSDIRMDGQIHRGGRLINGALMVVELNESDFRATGTRYVTVTQAGQAPSRAVELTIRSEADVRVQLGLPFTSQTREITVEARLILLAILMGIAGGALAALNSLASYRGDGKLTSSWFLYFFVGPFLGGGVSFFLYVVVRAGLLTGTGVTFESGTTPWGILAISGLAGLFYDKTLLKLREVFMALFSPRDERGGKLDDSTRAVDLSITTEALRGATRGKPYRAQLVAVGGEPELSWTVEPSLPAGLQLDPLTGVIDGTPAGESPLASYAFTVTDMRRRTAGAAVDFEVRP